MFRRLVVATVLLGLFVWPADEGHEVLSAGEKPHSVWQTRMTARLSDVPVADFLAERAEVAPFVWFLDRRVDPNTLVSCSFNDVSLAEGLEQVAADYHLGLCFMDRFLYVGTPQTAGEFLLLREEIHRELADNRSAAVQRLLVPTSFEYADFSVPRSLLEQLAKKTKFNWAKLDNMPHDVWRGNSLPAVPACDWMTLFLAGFEVRLQVDATRSELMPVAIKQDESIERTWTGRSLPSADELAGQFPECRFTGNRVSEGTRISGSGPFAAMAQVEYELDRRRRLSVWNQSSQRAQKESEKEASRNHGPLSQKRISGKIQNTTLKTVFESIQKDQNLTLTLDNSLTRSGTTLQTRISCEFQDSNETEMLDILGQALSATWRKEGTTVIFFKK